MATVGEVRFCFGCGFKVDKNFRFCPKCGNEITTERPSTNTVCDSVKEVKSLGKKVKLSLPSFKSFQAKKEKERSSFHYRKKGGEKTSNDETQVTIQVGVMKDRSKIKRGETIPVKVMSSATPSDILQAAQKKHEAFNKRFHKGGNYRLVYKDGSEVKFIPGTNPEEPFSLSRYKEESGFGYARICFYLLKIGNIFDQLKEVLEQGDSDIDLSSEAENEIGEEIPHSMTCRQPALSSRPFLTQKQLVDFDVDFDSDAGN